MSPTSVEAYLCPQTFTLVQSMMSRLYSAEVITWHNADVFSIEPLVISFNEIQIKNTFPVMIGKCNLRNINIVFRFRCTNRYHRCRFCIIICHHLKFHVWYCQNCHVGIINRTDKNYTHETLITQCITQEWHTVLWVQSLSEFEKIFIKINGLCLFPKLILPRLVHIASIKWKQSGKLWCNPMSIDGTKWHHRCVSNKQSYRMKCSNEVCLTHWGRDKMATISQTIFSNALF